MEISDGVAGADGKPVFLMLGVHHAREWPSGEMSMEFAFDLAQQFGKSARITALLRRTRVIVVPIVNRDGFNASRESPDRPPGPGHQRGTGRARHRRLPAQELPRRGRHAASASRPSACEANPGVDLNRNYGINWGSSGASSSDQAPDYRGAGPFSEPESEAVRRLVASRNVTMLITNHTSGRLVLRPPGVRAQGTVPDEAGLRALGDRMAAAMGYTSEKSWELYDNSGTTEDWSYGVTGAYGYTIESSDQNFHEAYEKAVVGEYLRIGGGGNREAFLRALEAAADPAGHSVIEGFAPPGRMLRLTRKVDSRTGPVCVTQPTGFFSTDCGATTAPLAFSDQLAVARRVGGDGVVGWHVNPSVSPLARPERAVGADLCRRVRARARAAHRPGAAGRIGAGVPALRPAVVRGRARDQVAEGAHGRAPRGCGCACAAARALPGSASCGRRGAACGWPRGPRSGAAGPPGGPVAPAATCWRSAPGPGGAPRSAAAR